MAKEKQKGNYRLQLRNYGIGLAVAVVISVILAATGITNVPVSAGIVLAVLLFEIMHFFILRDRDPEPLTQVSMRKDVSDFYKEEDK